MRTNDKITGLLTAVFGVLVITNSRGLAPLPQQEYGAGTFPAIIGALLIVFGGLLFMRGLRSNAGLLAWTYAVPIKRFLITTLAIVGAIVAYILLTPVIGFPVVSSVLLSVLLYAFYRKSWALAVVIALFSTAVIWGIFGHLLQVPLELGVLEKVIY